MIPANGSLAVWATRSRAYDGNIGRKPTYTDVQKRTDQNPKDKNNRVNKNARHDYPSDISYYLAASTASLFTQQNINHFNHLVDSNCLDTPPPNLDRATYNRIINRGEEGKILFKTICY
jgi:hypothetical protein